MDFAYGVINVSFDLESTCRSLKVAMAAPVSFYERKNITRVNPGLRKADTKNVPGEPEKSSHF